MREYGLGIDFGVSKSVVCSLVNGKPTLIPSSDGKEYFDNYVAFTDDAVLVGEAAKRRYTTHPDKVVRAVKKDLGKNIKREYHGQMYSPQQISAYILKKIKKDSEEFLNCSVDDAVITVPAYFDNNQRTATKDAAMIAGLNAEIINEYAAACLAYGIGDDSQNQTILVFDLSGGTFDVTVIQFNYGIFEIKATSGDSHLGVTDIDSILAEFLIREFEKQHGVKVNLNMDRQLRNVLIDAAKRVRQDLSIVYETEVNLPNMALDLKGNPLNLVTHINRNQLEELIKPILKRCERQIETALNDALMSKKDIDKLILIGKGCKMPAVRKFIQNFTGIIAEDGIDPEICVAQGAAIYSKISHTGNI